MLYKIHPAGRNVSVNNYYLPWHIYLTKQFSYGTSYKFDKVWNRRKIVPHQLQLTSKHLVLSNLGLAFVLMLIPFLPQQVNHTSWVAVVTPADHPKSVRNRSEIDFFCGVVCVVTLPFWHFCWCRGFCHRTESDLFLFLLSCPLDFWISLGSSILLSVIERFCSVFV